MRKVLLMALGLVALFAFTACDDEEEENGFDQEQITQRLWQEYPESYTRYCDHRFEFRLLRCERVGTAVDIEYLMINRYFNKDVKATFYMGETPAHDNIGNAYKCKQSAALSDVISYINGSRYSVYGLGVGVTFVPNQAIRGSFTIKNFDINATMVSVACHVDCGTPDVTFDQNMIEFVNIPVNEIEENETPEETPAPVEGQE